MTLAPSGNGFTNVSVAGPDGGPFNITFGRLMSGIDVPELSASVTGPTTADFDTPVQGGLTAANVQAALETIPELAGNVTVTTDIDGQFFVAFNGDVSGPGVANRDVPFLTTQTTGGRVEPFDDRVVARATLAERGFHAGA